MSKQIYLVIFLLLSIPFVHAQDITFYGQDGIEITTSQDNLPKPGENTHFGVNDVGNSSTLIFTVKNIYEGFFNFIGLVIPVPEISGENASAFAVTNPISNILAFGESTTFTVSFNPDANGIKDAIITIKPTLLFFPIAERSFNIRGVGISPVLTVLEKGGNEIINNSPASFENNTNFREVSVGKSVTYTYLLKNEGTKPLVINGDIIGSIINESVSGEFSYLNLPIFPLTILPDDFVEFSVKYEPQDTTEDTMTLSLNSNDSMNSPFKINYKGNGTNASASEEIMFTQYFENGNDDQIEIKNISNTRIPNRKYYLGIYQNGRNLNSSPNSVIRIGNLNAGAVRTFGNFSFVGNEILVISTVNGGSDFYANRVDVIGEHETLWGANISFTKSSCTSEQAHLNFYKQDWLALKIDEVNVANSSQNIDLGTHNTGPIIWNGSSWSNSSLPDISRKVILNGEYAATNGTLEACELVVNANVNFDNNTTNSLVVYGNLEIKGTLIIGDTESLVMYQDNAFISGVITKKEKSTLLNNINDITYWSSPVNKANLATVFSGVSPNRIFKMLPENINPNYAGTDFAHWFIASGEMELGRAYAAQGNSMTTYPNGQHEISFTGVPNNGKIYTQIVANNTPVQVDGWNLVGNPYPSAINADSFINGNAGRFDGTLYYWTHGTPISGGEFTEDDYILYNLSGSSTTGVTNSIGSAQGFMVWAESTSMLSFDNSMRVVNQNNQFYKTTGQKGQISNSPASNKIWLKINAKNQAGKSILIAFLEGATDAVDFGYDGKLIENYAGYNFYSFLEDKKYTIQGLGKFSADKQVSLGFDLTEPETLTIGIQETQGEIKNKTVWLVDNELRITHDLSQNDYTFEQMQTGEFNGRFTLRFANAVLDVDAPVSSNHFIISCQENSLKINASQHVNSIKLYDMLGRLILQSEPNKQRFQLDVHHVRQGSILIVHATLENGNTIRKKTIKQ